MRKLPALVALATFGCQTVPEYSALRTETQTYVEYTKTNERELYDLKRDPVQMQSIHGDAGAARLERLSKRLAVLRQCKGESCF